MAATKKVAAAKAAPAPPSGSKFKGKMSKRVANRLITMFGVPKTRKTTSVADLPLGKTKWIAVDPNCFARETQFITSTGVKSFEDFKHGDVVHVRSHTGKFRKAIVRAYGPQALMTLVVGRGPNKQTFRATPNHRWLLEGGEVKCTSELRSGDAILKPPTPLRDWSFDDSSYTEQWAWLAGFVWGDGSVQMAHGKETGSKLRLCGEKVKFLDRITGLGFNATYPDSADGEPCFQLPELFKRLPEKDSSIELLTAFVRGYLDADGTHNTRGDLVNPFTCMQATGEESVNFIRSMFPVVGAYISSERDISDEVTNFGPRNAQTVRFNIVMGFSSSPVAPYIVRSTEVQSFTEEVWCLEVENDQSFVMPSGVVTGNCIATLDALGRLPHSDDIHEFSSLPEVVQFTNELLDAAEKGEDLGFLYLVLDSITQLNNWHQMQVSGETTQRYLGEEAGKGWQQFNADMGKLLDNLAKLTLYITVVVIGHVKVSDFKKKGSYAALSLPPQMAERLAQLSNWLLYKTFEEVIPEPGEVVEEDDYISSVGEGDAKKYYESVLWTKPCGNIIASVNSLNLKTQEPGGSLWALMQKAGIAQE